MITLHPALNTDHLRNLDQDALFETVKGMVLDEAKALSIPDDEVNRWLDGWIGPVDETIIKNKGEADRWYVRYKLKETAIFLHDILIMEDEEKSLQILWRSLDALAAIFARRTASDKYREMYDLARQAQIVTIAALPRRQSVTP